MADNMSVPDGISDSLPEVDLKAITDYVVSRQTPEGGFSFYRSWGVEEPNTSDTWSAILSLSLLGRAIPERELCIDWLHSQQRRDGSFKSISTAWYTSYSLQLLSQRLTYPCTEWLESKSLTLFNWSALQNAQQASDYLREVLLLITLWQKYQIEIEARHKESLIQFLNCHQDPSGGYLTSNANLVDTAQAMALQKHMHLVHDQRLLRFARACEDPVFGFRAVPAGQSTYLSVVVAGLSTLAAFNEKPHYPEAMLQFVATCQRPSGGFARHIDALPSLRDTATALSIFYGFGLLAESVQLKRGFPNDLPLYPLL